MVLIPVFRGAMYGTIVIHQLIKVAPSEGFEPSTRGLEHRCRSIWLRGGKWMAERTGFEPVIGTLARCLLSRKVLSITQPTFLQ